MSTGRKHKDYLYRAHVMGGSTTVLADRARQVILDLHQRMSYSAMGAALDSSHTYVAAIARGKIKRISPSREAAILALRDHRPEGTHAVTTLGATRRVRALHALGWTWVAITAESGVKLSTVKNIANEKWPLIEARHHNAIAETYERLSMRLPVPTSSHDASAIGAARNKARVRHWLPPMAWDDPDTDAGPVEVVDNAPDPVVIDRILAGDMSLARTATKAERVEVVARWQGSLAELERATGWRPDRYRKEGAA